MRRLFVVTLAAFAVVLFLATASIAQVMDVRARFLASNPNNGWEYGFINEEGSFVAYNTTFDDGQGIAGWTMDNTPGPMGDVTINYTDHPIDRYGVRWEPGQICVNSPMVGRGVVVRWHAPDSACVQIDTVLTAQSSDANANIQLQVDGDPVIEGNIGASAATDLTSNTAPSVSSSRSAASEVESDEFRNSTIVTVENGCEVDFVIASEIGSAPSHLGAVISISSVSPSGVRSSKASVGRKSPVREAGLFGLDKWLRSSSFDIITLLRRG
ncbi:MAG: hypothetical protein NT018_11810 [Armatimonadetes bacterium]|nr:hypothetical protein [Armatimonadota bacterium]